MKENQWLCGAAPALCIHSCIGSVYCWSLLKADIASEMHVPVTSIEFAFSLAIFFLGMSAAFGGRFVEKNVRAASALSLCCFVSGLLLAALAVSKGSVPGLFLSYGALMGVGLGIGYLSPVKTLMLWFRRRPGLATGIAISGFGLSKVLFSPLIEFCLPLVGAKGTLVTMACVSLVPMAAAVALIRKPAWWIEAGGMVSLRDCLRIVFNTQYIRIWIVFYLNITCGLALIAFEKSIGLSVGITSIALLASGTAVFNTLGRFGYSTSSDLFTRKVLIYVFIFASSAAVCFLGTTLAPFLLILALCVVNAGYGGGFSTLPIILRERFGMEKISMIHGFALSAWAWAGLSGNQLSSYIINSMGKGYGFLLTVLGCLYLVSLVISLTLLQKKKAENA